MLRTTGLDDGDHLAVIGQLVNKAALSLATAGKTAVPMPSWLENAHTQGVSTPNE